MNSIQSTSTPRSSRVRVFQPAIDLVELDQEFLVQADMPGIDPKDIDITCERGMLSIHGRISDDQLERRERSRSRAWLREYGVGDYRREIRLGDGVDPERIQADYSDGVLTVHLPKAAAAAPRRVAIKGTEAEGDGRQERRTQERPERTERNVRGERR
jgi:HSP20 family protein